MNRRGFLGTVVAALGLTTTCRKAPPLNEPTTLDALYGGAAGGGKTGTFDRERLRTHANRGQQVADTFDAYMRDYEIHRAESLRRINRDLFADGANLPIRTPLDEWLDDPDY